MRSQVFARVRQHLSNILVRSAILRVPQNRVEHTTLETLGMDSLDRIELANNLEHDFSGLTLHRKDLRENLTVGELVTLVCDKLSKH